MLSSARPTRRLRVISIALFVSILCSLLPQPSLRTSLLGVRAVAAAEIAPDGQAGPGAVNGTLRFPAVFDADPDASTNPLRTLPVARIGGVSLMASHVHYATVKLAVEVLPAQAAINPAGTLVRFHLWNTVAEVDIVQEARTDAWGAATAELILDNQHLLGQFHYTASAAGLGTTPVRSFSVDTTRFSSDVRLGGARLTTQVEGDGRLVVNVESDVAIDEQLLAAQLTAVRLIPTADPHAPERELLPPLVMRRLDAHHARAEIYLDTGDYLLLAATRGGSVEAQSAPRLVHITNVRPPAVAAVERMGNLDAKGRTALVQYRTPNGDVALLRRALADLPTTEPSAANEELFKQRTRVGAFQWRTDSYKISTLSADTQLKATLAGFAYDPIARRYNLVIESQMPQRVADRLQIEVLGPNGIVIYEESIPVELDPAEPLQHQITVPADRGEPYGLRVGLRQPQGPAAANQLQLETSTPTATVTPTATLFVPPTNSPTIPPTDVPTEEPTAEPTEEPTDEPTDTPEPTETPEPTDTPEPTATPQPTNTPEPTATRVPTDTPEPTATSEPTATATPEPTATQPPTPTEEPTERPEPASWLGWFIQYVGDEVTELFDDIARIIPPSEGLSDLEFKVIMKFITVEFANANILCHLGAGCTTKYGGPVFDDPDWIVDLTTRVDNHLRNEFNTTLAKIEEDPYSWKMPELEIGALELTTDFDAEYSKQLLDPRECPDPVSVLQATAMIGALGLSLKEAATHLSFRFNKGSLKLRALSLQAPVPNIWFLGVAISPILSFTFDAGSTFTGIYVKLHAEIGLEGKFTIAPDTLLKTLYKLRALYNFSDDFGELIDTAKESAQTFQQAVSAVKVAVAQFPCPPDPPPPNGHPDDRRDAFQNEFLPTPKGTSGQIAYSQQQIATAEGASLNRAATYWTLQLRQQELAAFESDTTKALSNTAEVEQMFAATELRMQGLLSGTLELPAGQTITQAIQFEYDSVYGRMTRTSYELERRALRESLAFAERRYNELRGQELELQREFRLMTQAAGVGVLDSGLVTWALTAIGSIGVNAKPVQIVPGVSSSRLPDSRYYGPYEAPPVLLVPSGGLHRYGQNEQARGWLDAYVRSGGTLIVLSQADQQDWAMLPGGEVQGLGYQQDILCRIASVRITNASPWIVGIDHDLPDIQVDGSFTAWPSNANVVLMRTTGNQMPAMIEYPYGNGQVIATSAYPDFYINGMQSLDDVVFARSLFGLAYLRGTGQSVAATATSGQTIEITRPITNTTALTTTRLTLWSDYYGHEIAQSWRWAVHQPHQLRASQVINLSPSLPSGAARSQTFRFTAPRQAGLFRTGYFWGRHGTWAASGAIPGPFYQVQGASPAPTYPIFKLWQDQPAYAFGMTAIMTATLHNTQPVTRTFTLQPLAGLGAAPRTLVVGPHASVTQQYSTVVRTRREVRLGVYENNALLNQLVTTLRVRPPVLGMEVAPNTLVAGLPATLHLTATTKDVVPGTPIEWELRRDGDLLADPQTPLVAGTGYNHASTDVPVPAPAPDSVYTVRAALPDNTQMLTQTLAVLPPVAVNGASIFGPLMLDTNHPSAIIAKVKGTSYGGSADVQAMVESSASTVAAGPIVTVQLGEEEQQVTLDLLLPPSLDLNQSHAVVISATGRAAGGTVSYPANFGISLPLRAPTVTLPETWRKVGDPLPLHLTTRPGEVALPAAGPYTVTLKGLTVPFSHTLVIATATPIDGALQLNTTVPELAQGGVYQAIVASPRLVGWQATALWSVPEHRLHYTAPTTLNAGDIITWGAKNIGGVATTLTGALVLVDERGTRVAQTPVNLQLSPEVSRTVTLGVPAQLHTGKYMLHWRGTDHLGKPLATDHRITLSGLSVALDSHTDQTDYLPSDQVQTTNTISTSAPLIDAWLRLQVLTPQADSGPLANFVPIGPPRTPPAPYSDGQGQELLAGAAQTRQAPPLELAERHPAVPAAPNRAALLQAALARRDHMLATHARSTATHRLMLPFVATGTVGGTNDARLATRPTLNPATTNFVPAVLTSDTTWTAAGSPYVISGTVTVPPAVTLTLEPGAIVKFNTAASLVINGALTTPTGSEKAILTSIHDDSAGGDTDEEEIIPQRGDWSLLSLTRTGNHILNALDIRYGTDLDSAGPLTLTDSTFTQMSEVSITHSGASTIVNNHFDALEVGVVTTDDVTGTTVLSNTFVNNSAPEACDPFGYCPEQEQGIMFYGDVRQLTMQGNQWLDGSSGTGLHMYGNSEVITITNNLWQAVVPGPSDCCAGINFWQDAADVVIADNQFLDLPLEEGGNSCCYGINFWETSARITIRDNRLEGSFGIYNGLNLWDNVEDLTISSNQFIHNRIAPPDDYDLFGNSVQIWGNVERFGITDNAFRGAAEVTNGGLQIWGEASDGLIEGNNFEGISGGLNGLMFWDAVTRVTISHNTLRGFIPYTETDDQGIVLWDVSSHLTITDNLIEGVFNGGIRVYGAVTDSLIARNHIQGGYGTETGIVFGYGVARSAITDNHVTDIGAYNGWRNVYDGYNGIVIRNRAYYYAIPNTDVLIARNTLARLSGPGSGIFVNGSTTRIAPSRGITITENVVYDNPQGGIHLMDAITQATVSYNLSARNRFGLWLLGTGSGVTASSNTFADASGSTVQLYSGLMNYPYDFYGWESGDTLLASGGNHDWGAVAPLLKHNLLSGSGSTDVNGVGTAGITPTLRYNDGWNAVQPGITRDGGATGTPLATYDPTNLSVDPQFIDQPIGDYRLQDNSPVRDAGDPTEVDPGTNSRIDIGALVQASNVIYETWQAVAGNGTLTYNNPLTNPSLLANPRARGPLVLAATLFSRDPAQAIARQYRHVLASDQQGFFVASTPQTVTLVADAHQVRPHTVVPFRGRIYNAGTTTGETLIVEHVWHENGAFQQAVGQPLTFPDLAPGDTTTFAFTQLLTATGTHTLTVQTGSGATATSVVEVIQPGITIDLVNHAVDGIVYAGTAATFAFQAHNGATLPAVLQVQAGDQLPQPLALAPNASATLELSVPIPADAASGQQIIPITITGDLNQTRMMPVSVRNETATATLALSGTTHNTATLVQGDDAGLALTITNPELFAFDAGVDYVIGGAQGLSGSQLITLPPGTTTLAVPLGSVPTGAYSATTIIRRARNDTSLATAAHAFVVVAPQYNLTLDLEVDTPDAAGNVYVQLRAASAATSDRPWTGILALSEPLAQTIPFTLAPGAEQVMTGMLALRDRAGEQTINVILRNPDGTLQAEETLVVAATPRLAPQVRLTNVTAGLATPGGTATLTATFENDGPTGEVPLTIEAFDQTVEQFNAVATGQSDVAISVAVPAGLLAGTYPVSVRVDETELRTEVTVQGAEIDLHQQLDATSYEAFAQATWTVELAGTRGGPASYDVFMRYGTAEYTRTVTVGAGDTVAVPWTFDVGPSADRATVLVTNHPSDGSQTRYTVIIDSQMIPVIEDPRAWLSSDKPSYDAGEAVNLTLHLVAPTRSAMVLAPDNLFTTAGPLVWSSLPYSTTELLQGDFTMAYTLPPMLPTGRYFFRYTFDGEERTLPIDVFGVTLTTEEFSVESQALPPSASGSAVNGTAQRAAVNGPNVADPIAASMALTITGKLRLDEPVAAIIKAFALAPDGSYHDLGSGATFTTTLPAGVTPISLSALLTTAEPGAHQIVLLVRDAVEGVELGGDAQFVDIGGAVLTDLATDQGLYVPGEAGTGTINLYGVDQATVRVTTSDGTLLLDQVINGQGHQALSFSLPTATERDEVLVATITDSQGLRSTRQVAYKVAAQLDTTAPVVAVVAPANLAAVEFPTADRLITLQGTVADDGEVVEVLVEGVAAILNGSNWSAQVELAYGTNLLQIVARDRAGNVGLALHSITGEPAYGSRLLATPSLVQPGEIVTFATTITATDQLTATALFPYSGVGFELLSGSATTGTLSLADQRVQWQGIVTPDAPVVIEWTARATVAGERTLFALVQGEQMLPRKSNEIVVQVATVESTPTATATATATPSSEATTLPTSTATPTASPEASVTPTSTATATATPEATALPTSTATVTATPEASVTSTTTATVIPTADIPATPTPSASIAPTATNSPPSPTATSNPSSPTTAPPTTTALPTTPSLTAVPTAPPTQLPTATDQPTQTVPDGGTPTSEPPSYKVYIPFVGR